MRPKLTSTLIVAIVFLMGWGLAAAEPLKLAFVYVSPVGDVGWTRSHDDARRHLESLYGDRIETRIVESVAEGAASRQVITDLAQAGMDMIFTTSWGYMVPTEKVANVYPNVKFEHATGLRRGDNLSTYANRAYEGRYLAGILAGRMTQSNKIGYVAAYPVVEVIRGINAFTLGVRSVNPNAEVHVAWSHAWYNPSKASALANQLIDQGVDVMTQHTDSPAPLQAAEARGVMAIGYHTDMSAYAPNHHLASVVHNWRGIYEQRLAAFEKNAWTSQPVWLGLKEDAIKLASISARVPSTVVAEVEQAKQAIIQGERDIFAGPVLNHRGRTKVRDGKRLDDDDLNRMNWFVQGVQGDLTTF